METMFTGCIGLTELDLSGFDTAGVQKMGGMFSTCSSLKTIYASSYYWSTESLVDNTYGMFANCNQLVGGAGTAFNPSLTTGELAQIDQGWGSHPGYLTELKVILLPGEALNKEIKGGAGYNTIDQSVLSVTFGDSKTYAEKVKGVAGVPVDINRRGIILLYRVPDENEAGKFNVYILSRGKILAEAQSDPMTSNSSFCKLAGMKTIDFSNYDTSEVLKMNGMFQGCSSLTSVDVSGFDTTKVAHTSYMFSGCTSLETLDLQNFSMTALRSTGQMFNKCTNLKSLSLDFSKWTLDSAYPWGVSMASMFAYCGNLTDVDLGGLDTSAVVNGVDMSEMFNGCKMERLDLSGWDTSNVTNMWIMFADCPNLVELDISSFDTSRVTNMESMFAGCWELTTIYASDLWTTTAVTSGDNMFGSDDNLVGGAGTTFDDNVIDKTYARIDEGASSPGYFTRKAVVNTLNTGVMENNILAETVRGAASAEAGSTFPEEEKEDKAAGSGSQLDETGPSSSTPPVTDETTPTQPQEPAEDDSADVPPAAPSSSPVQAELLIR